MFTTPKRVVESKTGKVQPSIEHRTQIQLELQELRNLVLESKSLEAQFTDLKESIAFQAESMKTYK